MFHRSIAIVQASASHVAFARLSRSRGGPIRLEEYTTEAFPLDPAAETTWDAAVAGAMTALRSRVAYRGPVGLVLPAHLILTKHLTTPLTDGGRGSEIVQFEARQNIPFALEEVVWGTMAIGESAAGREMMLCAAKLAEVEALCIAAESAGFCPVHVIPGPAALVAATRLAPALWNAGTLVLKIGSRSTAMFLFGPGGVRFRSFLLGGNNVTQQIAAELKCGFADAEAAKIAGKEPQVTAVAMIAFATRLTQEVTRSMLQGKSVGSDAKPTSIRLAGGGARLPGLTESLSGKIGTPVEVTKLFEFCGEGHDIDFTNPVAEGLLLDDAMAAGAATLAGGLSEINLLPLHRLHREIRRTRRPWFAAAAGFAAASLIGPLLHLHVAEQALRRERIALERELELRRAQEAQRGVIRTRLAETEGKLAALDELEIRRRTWLELLAEMQEKLGRVGNVWLESLRIIPEPPAHRTQTEALPLRLAISGLMLDQGHPPSGISEETYRRAKDLLASFARSPGFADAETEAFDPSQPGVLRFHFVLTAHSARAF